MGCEQCGAPSAEFFTTGGAQVCQPCFNREQVQMQDTRAEAALAAELPDGLRRAKTHRPRKPGRVLLIGVVMLTTAVVANLCMLVFLEDFDFKFLTGLGFAFVVTIQGYKTRHYQ